MHAGNMYHRSTFQFLVESNKFVPMNERTNGNQNGTRDKRKTSKRIEAERNNKGKGSGHSTPQLKGNP
jgi:hypothetical protein